MTDTHKNLVLSGFFCVCILIYSVPGICQPPSEPIPSLFESIRFKQDLFLCNSRIPLEDPQVREDLEREMLLALWNRPQVILWMKRASAFFPHIEAILAAENLPDDLKYVPIIESGLRPHARSSANAVGYWQFMAPTAQQYGLRMDNQLDERRNFIKSTRAACRYFKSLHDRFGCYLLALAAYNMGENGLEKEIDAQQTRNFFDLYLPFETQYYVLKILAAKQILENPGTFGFHPQPGDLYPMFRFSQIDVTSEKPVPLFLVARAAGISFKTLKLMNPDIRGYDLMPGSVSVLVPPGSEKGFKEAFDALHAQWLSLADKPARLHVVQPGETLTGIAKKYTMTLPALLRLNQLPSDHVIHPGDRIKVR